MKKISSRKLVRQLAVGGSTPDPLAGVGLQYVSSAPELPNVNAAMYFDQARRQSDDALQEERKRLAPDQKAIFELISNAPGTSGHKSIVSSEVADAIKSYRERLSENPDWGLTPEGRDALSNIENLTSPARFQEMADKQRQIQLAYDNAFKSGTLNQYHIRDGMISVVDSQTGQRHDIPMSEFEKDQKAVNPRFRALRVSDAYNLADQHQDFDMSAHQVFGDMLTAQQAREELISYFDDLGKTVASDQLGITTTGGNAYQRARAKDQAIAALSSKAKDALRSDFIEKTGSYSERDFEQYLSTLIDTESEKRKISSFDVNASALAALNKQSGSSSDGVVVPTEIPTSPDFNIRLNTRPWYGLQGKREASLYRFAGSNIETDKTQKPLTVNGRVYLYGDLSPFDRNTSDEYGGAYVTLNTTFGNTVHVENSIFAVKTGLIRKWNEKKGEYEDKMMENQAGNPIIRSTQGPDNIRRPASPKVGYTSDGQQYLYFEDQKNNQIVVEMRGFEVHDIYEGKIGDSDETEKKATVLIPVDRDKSIQYWGVNRSGIHHNDENIVVSGESVRFTSSAEATLSQVMRGNISQQERDVLTALYTGLSRGPESLTPSQRQVLGGIPLNKVEMARVLNSRINHYKDVLTDEFLFKNATRPKIEYTPTSGSDNRN